MARARVDCPHIFPSPTDTSRQQIAIRRLGAEREFIAAVELPYCFNSGLLEFLESIGKIPAGGPAALSRQTARLIAGTDA
jgi:hypothetical protein